MGNQMPTKQAKYVLYLDRIIFFLSTK